MRVQAIVGGAGLAVGYLVSDHASRAALMIDAPPGTKRRVMEVLGSHDLRLECIVSTHGHWDSCADCAALVEATGAPLLAHSWDATRLANPNLTLEPNSPFKVQGCRADRGLSDGEILQVGRLEFSVLHTPGHSPGSICLYEEAKQAIFTGDTLLAGKVGNTDAPGGNTQMLAESLRRLGSLPPATQVFPAHGQTTTIALESWIFELAV